MRRFTIHCRHRMDKWQAGLKTSLRPLVTLLLLGIVFIPGANAQSGVAPVDPPTGGMNIDGFLQRQEEGIGDWLRNVPLGLTQNGTFLFTDGGVATVIAAGKIFHRTDLFDHTDDEIFDGGNKLNDNPNDWGWRSNKPPAKDDINHSLVFITQDANDHIWVLVTGDRLSNNGTSHLDMEFYQVPIFRNDGEDPPGAPVLGETGGFHTDGLSGGRTIGDLDVTLSYTGGGTIASITILQWAPTNDAGTQFDYVTVDVSGVPAKAFVAANDNPINVPFGAFGSNTYDDLQFIEAAIDVTAIIGGGTGDVCDGLPFKTLFIKTKSSASKTADLKDFIEPLQINPCFDDIPSTVSTGGTATSLGCNPSGSAINAALGTATAIDNCGTPTLTSSDGAIQSSGCNRSQTRSWSAVDGCGNVTTAARTVQWVADATVPSITTGGNNTPLGCNPSGSQINAALGTATASDGCGAVTLISSDGPVITNGCDRQQTRTWTATDGCLNTATASRTANWTQAPALTITCPGDLHFQCSDANTSTAVTGVATPTGGCNPVVAFTDQPTERSCAKLIKRKWTATDACGQTATCNQNILVADNTPPVIICNGTNATVTDNCTPPASILIFSGGGVLTAVDASGNISTATCAVVVTRVATSNQQQMEQTATVTKEEEKSIAPIGKKLVPDKSGNLAVYAFPNPYTDQVNFRFVSPQSGLAKLELYDMVGKRIAVVNIGNVQAGIERSFNYKVPGLKRVTMMYKITVGGKSGNGTLISGARPPSP